MAVSVEVGSAALELVGNATFRQHWSSLQASCPWATAFQGPEFVGAWYNTYRDEYEPVLAYEMDRVQGLTGLLAMAAPRDGQGVVHAGGRQAEYHSFLAMPDQGDAFAQRALEALRRRYPAGPIVFRYLPPGAPLGWTASDSPLARLTLVVTHRRPLMQLGDGVGLTNSLRKKSNKSRLNRLKRLGEIRFERIRTRSSLQAVLDPIIRAYDLRQGAVHNSVPFADDARKREFHLRLMEEPDLLHVTVLRAGETLVAAHLGIRSGHTLHLGIIAHTPSEARHSPAKLHLYLLGKHMLEEGLTTLDLTPGGDEYKDRFANEHDTVHEVTVFATRRAFARRKAIRTISRAAKQILGLLHIDIRRLRALLAGLAQKKWRALPVSIAKATSRAVYRHREFRVYRFSATGPTARDPRHIVAKDQVGHLLLYAESAAWRSRKQFLATALARLEDGQHVYTVAESGRLLHWGWLIESQADAFFSEVRQPYRFPPKSACLYDFYTVPQARGRGLYTASLRAMLADIAEEHMAEQTYVGVLADNAPSRHVIEKLGFRYEASLHERVVFGFVKRWRDVRSKTGSKEAPCISS